MARRSGRQTTQISTLASDGLAKSPSLAKQSPVQSGFKTPAHPTRNEDKEENKKEKVLGEKEKVLGEKEVAGSGSADLNYTLDDLPSTQVLTGNKG